MEKESKTNTDQEGIVERHDNDHQIVRTKLNDWITVYREYLHLEDEWSIVLHLCCPEELPEQEATIQIEEKLWFATLSIRCDLPEPLLEWALVHELYRIKLWRITSIVQDMIETYSPIKQNFFTHQYSRVLSQEIESSMRIFLGIRRPAHLIA